MARPSAFADFKLITISNLRLWQQTVSRFITFVSPNHSSNHFHWQPQGNQGIVAVIPSGFRERPRFTRLAEQEIGDNA
jgi:hypothetical protein